MLRFPVTLTLFPYTTLFRSRYGPLLGTSVLGVLWAGWHLPLFLTSPWGDDTGVSGLAVFTVFCVAVSVVITRSEERRVGKECDSGRAEKQSVKCRLLERW